MAKAIPNLQESAKSAMAAGADLQDVQMLPARTDLMRVVGFESNTYMDDRCISR